MSEENNTGNDGQKTFTQEQLDTILQERLARAENSAQAKILADLGIESFDAAKAQLQELGKIKEAQMSELEKQAAKQQELETLLKRRENEVKEAKEAMAKQRIETAVLLAAKDFSDPNDALAFIDTAKISIDENGKVSGVEAVIEQLKKDKPYLFKATNPNNGSFVHRRQRQLSEPKEKPKGLPVRF